MGQPIDLDMIVAELESGVADFRGFGLTTPTRGALVSIRLRLSAFRLPQSISGPRWRLPIALPCNQGARP
jgi:hypothetical protein